MGDSCRGPAPEICLHRPICVGCSSRGVLLCVSTWKEKEGEQALCPTPHQPGGLPINLADPAPRGAVASEVLSRSSVCVRAKSLQSCPTLQPCPRDSPGNNTGVGCHFLLQEVFPPQGLNPGLSGLLHRQASHYRVLSITPLEPTAKLQGCGEGTPKWFRWLAS